ncbi:MAG: LysR family transcriptional regulator [Pseudomonadota bacterium]
MLDRLRQLAIFAKVVETGSFRGAAKDLTLSPSVVSHHIAKLESDLGVALLYRSTRALSLTKDGETLLKWAQEMVTAAEGGLDGITAGSCEPTGRLKITAPAVLAHSRLIEVIATFSAAHPKVDLDVSFTDVRKDIIGEGIDLAIRMGWLKDSALKSKKVASEERLLLAAPSYLEGQHAPDTPSDLQSWQFLYLSGVGRQFEFENKSGDRSTLTVGARIVVDDAVALYRLVRAGAGVGTLPLFLAKDDLKSGKVVHVLPDWRPKPLGIYAVWPPNAPRASLTTRFVSYLTR